MKRKLIVDLDRQVLTEFDSYIYPVGLNRSFVIKQLINNFISDKRRSSSVKKISKRKLAKAH